MANQLKQYLTNNRDKLIFITLVIVLAGGGKYLYERYQTDRREEARDLFVQSQNMLLFPGQADDRTRAHSQAGAQFRKISQDFSKLPISAPAALYEASSHINQGQYDQSLAVLRAFIEKSTSEEAGPWEAMAERSICYSIELSGRLEEAEKAYEDLRAKDLQWLSHNELKFGQARCLLELNRTKDAKKLLNQILEDDPKSYWGQMASTLIAL